VVFLFKYPLDSPETNNYLCLQNDPKKKKAGIYLFICRKVIAGQFLHPGLTITTPLTLLPISFTATAGLTEQRLFL
jgi:hypothetical protein